MEIILFQTETVARREIRPSLQSLPSHGARGKVRDHAHPESRFTGPKQIPKGIHTMTDVSSGCCYRTS